MSFKLSSLASGSLITPDGSPVIRVKAVREVLFMALFFQWDRIPWNFRPKSVKRIPRAMEKMPINRATDRIPASGRSIRINPIRIETNPLMPRTHFPSTGARVKAAG